MARMEKEIFPPTFRSATLLNWLMVEEFVSFGMSTLCHSEARPPSGGSTDRSEPLGSTCTACKVFRWDLGLRLLLPSGDPRGVDFTGSLYCSLIPAQTA